MHLLIPIGLAVAVAVIAKRKCYLEVFYIASLVAAVLIGMEIQEKE